MAALAALQELSHEKVVKLRDAVAVTKNEEGQIKVHQTKDDSIGKGFVKGGLIGVVFAALFGPVGWIATGAAAGGLYASLDRGIKNRLLKELGENMTSSESAVAILVEHADWQTAVERMKAHGFGGQLVVSEIVAEDLAEVEKLLEDPETVASVPEELELVAPVVAEAAAGAWSRRLRNPLLSKRRAPAVARASMTSRGSAPSTPRSSRRRASSRPTTCSRPGQSRMTGRSSRSPPGSAPSSSASGSTRSISCASLASGRSTATCSRLRASARLPSSPRGTPRTWP
jgi:uncharacterized membrane protein